MHLLFLYVFLSKFRTNMAGLFRGDWVSNVLDIKTCTWFLSLRISELLPNRTYQ